MADKNDAEIFEGTSKEEESAVLRSYENDILGGLLKAVAYTEDEEEAHEVQIVRKGVLLFSFHIRSLTEAQYNKCKERYTKYIRHKQLGVKMPESTDTVKYRNALIYEATVKADREKVWDNKELWRQLDCLTGTEVIDKCLKPGEKDAVLNLIDNISGYSLTEEELAKN